VLTEWIRQEIELEECSACFGSASSSWQFWLRVPWRNYMKVSNRLTYLNWILK